MVLFLGPLYMQFLNGFLNTYLDPNYWIENVKNLRWLRNHIVAPLSEEFTFRSCMLPLLLQCFSPITAVFVCPLFFGVAHFHHMIELVRDGINFKTAFLMSCFHFSFTTIFGAYSAYLFLRTGHFMSSFIVHAFCNHMGMPDVSELLTYKGTQRVVIICVFFLGLVLWCYLLNPLTEPQWFYNDYFYNYYTKIKV
ncbi:CAAX prenyl protease 2 isoform X2 [Agrilus planipennis]|nr:CAAX prenyl protease 2 isoform X2 [Agrilus planipennis]